MPLITDLPASTSVASTDVFIKDTGSTTQKIPAAYLANELANMQGFVNVPLTRTENIYVDSTSFNRLRIYRVGRIGIFFLNLNVSGLSAVPDFIEIGSFSGTLYLPALVDVPAQNGSGVILLQVTTGGKISIYKEGSGTINGFCRADIPLFFE